jgi:hypothetical protein
VSRIAVRCEVDEYPDEIGSDREPLVVKNHWNLSDRVVLMIGGKERIFIAADLISAIEKASGER